jgi:transcriptional/translational regulatory protein YebC/TACO1
LHGGNLGTDGSVAYLFNKQGFISFASGDEDQIMEVALDAGAQDVISNDDDKPRSHQCLNYRRA